MQEIERLIQPHLLNLAPYSSARDEFTGKAEVYLDANENPFGTIGGGDWNRYPDPYQNKLKLKISELKNVPTANIFLGNGSDEPIDLLIKLFCRPTIDHILTFPPTYGMYQVSAGIQNVKVDTALLNEDFSFNMPLVMEKLKANPHIVFICSPNNPSGNAFPLDQIKQILDSSNGIVVVDEAYVDFMKEATCLSLLTRYPRLVVLQTFSKAWGMAALRLGMAFAHPYVIQMLNKIKAPYNISGIVQATALKSLAQSQMKYQWVGDLIENREWLHQMLLKTNFVRHVFPTDANFLLVKFEHADAMYDYLAGNGVIVRSRTKQPRCADCLRLTVGTRTENQQLISLIDSFKP